jgi:hypothetical protein
MSGQTMDKCMEAESAFVMFAVKQRWEVAKPIHHAQGYDYVIRRNGLSWETVQVKAAYPGRSGTRKPTREVSLRRCNEKGSHPYADGDFDLLFVYDGMNYCWLFPWDYVSGTKSSLTLGNSEYINHQPYMVKI